MKHLIPAQGRQTNLNLTSDLVDLIDDLAEEEGRSRSDWIERALRESPAILAACKRRKLILPRRPRVGGRT